jgi:DNA-binding IclR family transcriptional regulator
MPATPSAAPALTRGLALLEDLSIDGQRSLEHLARDHAWPKTSVLRLLQTLEAAGAVARDPASKRWMAVKRLVPDQGDAGERARLAAVLAHLAEASGGTAEWWVADGDRLVLAARHEPEAGEVAVRARIGYRRELAELEAATVAACAAGLGTTARRPWIWRDGRRVHLAAATVAARLAEARARQGMSWDETANPHGVARPWPSLAAPAGVLAVALVARDWPGRPPAPALAALEGAIA